LSLNDCWCEKKKTSIIGLFYCWIKKTIASLI